MWNSNSELLDKSYSVLNIQNYSECIIKKHERITNNPPIRVYVNKIENTITFKFKKEYHLQI